MLRGPDVVARVNLRFSVYLPRPLSLYSERAYLGNSFSLDPADAVASPRYVSFATAVSSSWHPLGCRRARLTRSHALSSLSRRSRREALSVAKSVPGPPISRSIARLVRATAVFRFAVHLRLLLRSAGREGYPLPNIISRSPPWGDAPLVDHLEFSQIYTQRSARDRLLSTSTHTRLRIRGRSADRIAKADVEGGGRGVEGGREERV